MINRLIISFFFILLVATSSAQQDVLYSQYLFNPFAINPAYAGSRQSISAVLLHRSQWVGVDNAPTTQTFSIHTPFEGKRVAAGFNLINDKIGPTSSLGMFGTYAYHLPTSNGKLSFGLKGGVYRVQLDGTLLDYKDKGDVYSNMSITSKWVPSFDFGMYYYTNNFFAGFAATHLSQQKIAYQNTEAIQAQLSRHYVFTLGNVFVLNKDILLKPSTMIKYVSGAPVNVDINCSALFYKRLWAGLSFRSSKTLVALLEINITDYLRAGYAYDYAFSELSPYVGGSHEIFVGFDFEVGKRKVISPRFL